MIDKEVLIKTTNCIKSADPNCPKPPTEEKSKTSQYHAKNLYASLKKKSNL